MDNPERVTYFAATDSRGKKVPFGIKQKDRDRHMYVIGKTGMGKSTLLENLAIQDLRNGEGLAFIDPHGETANKLLDYIPKDRIKDVVYFAPFDLDNPIAFNVMEDVGYDKRHLVVSGLMATFKKIWEDAWSARMEYILTNTLLALLEYPDATLLGVNRMYTDKAFRTKVVDNVKDPVVRDFWLKEFANFSDTYTKEATPAIQNKIGQFTGNPLIRNIIGQPKSTFDIRTMMDEKKILIINLSKGLVGETNMRLLGSMLTTRIFLAAMSRADLHGEALRKLPNFYFYVDEFQNFANETFAEILSEARKYKLNLVIAHQYVQQMEEEVRDAVFGNVGTTVVFRVGPFDAEVLETVFMPRFTKEDIVSLDKRQIYLTLMIDGVGSAPFSAVTIPPIETPPQTYRDEVIASSRTQFTAPRAGIESAIVTELETSTLSEAPVDARMRKGQYGPPGAKVKAPSTIALEKVMARQATEVPGPLPPRATPAQPLAITPRPSPAISAAPRAEQRPFAPTAVRPSGPTRPVTSSSPAQVAEASVSAAQRAQPFVSRPNTPIPNPQSKPLTPRPAPDNRPPSAAKSSEDLKAILRTMTAKIGKEKEQKQSTQQQSFKGALAGALSKTPAPTPNRAPDSSVVPQSRPAQPPLSTPPVSVSSPSPATMSTEAPRNVTSVENPAAQDVPVSPVVSNTVPQNNPKPNVPASSGAGQGTPSGSPPREPFEIPEETLRKVLRGEA